MRLTPSPYFLTTVHIIYVLSMFLGSSPVQSNPCFRPSNLTCYVGESAQFRWNTVRNSTILSATWGIKYGNKADPQFIDVDITSNKVNINSYLEPDLKKRLSFDGDLKNGRAWFTLKNVTVNDTNVYIASISDDVTRVLPYTVLLTVKEREQKDGNIVTSEEPKKTTDPSPSPEIARTTPTKVTETEIHTPKDPKGPANSNDYNLPTNIAALVALLASVLVLVIISAFLYRHKLLLKNRRKQLTIHLLRKSLEQRPRKVYLQRDFTKIKRSRTISSEKKLMKDKVDI